MLIAMYTETNAFTLDVIVKPSFHRLVLRVARQQEFYDLHFAKPCGLILSLFAFLHQSAQYEETYSSDTQTRSVIQGTHLNHSVVQPLLIFQISITIWAIIHFSP